MPLSEKDFGNGIHTNYCFVFYFGIINHMEKYIAVSGSWDMSRPVLCTVNLSNAAGVYFLADQVFLSYHKPFDNVFWQGAYPI